MTCAQHMKWSQSHMGCEISILAKKPTPILRSGRGPVVLHMAWLCFIWTQLLLHCRQSSTRLMTQSHCSFLEQFRRVELSHNNFLWLCCILLLPASRNEQTEFPLLWSAPQKRAAQPCFQKSHSSKVLLHSRQAKVSWVVSYFNENKEFFSISIYLKSSSMLWCCARPWKECKWTFCPSTSIMWNKPSSKGRQCLHLSLSYCSVCCSTSGAHHSDWSHNEQIMLWSDLLLQNLQYRNGQIKVIKGSLEELPWYEKWSRSC